MNEPGANAANRPSEQMIRDRLRNRRSLYELERTSASSLKKLKRSFMEEPEDISKAAPVWQRYPVRAFVAASCVCVLALTAGLVTVNALTGDRTANGADREQVALAVPADRAEPLVRSEYPAAPTPVPAIAIAPAGTMANGVPADGATRTIERAQPASARAESAPLPIRDGVAATPALSTIASSRVASVDRDLTTGSIERAQIDPEVASILERARLADPKAASAWPDMFETVTPPAPDKTAEPATVSRSEPVTAPARPIERTDAMSAPAASAIPIPAPNPVAAEGRTARDDVLTASAGEAAAPAIKPSVGSALTSVNLREAPEMDAPVLTVVAAGAPLTVLDCDNWCHVRYETTEGYVYGTYVKDRD
ncbi:SH3 domain-containing protein [Fulvimarina sp. 2208YS6-2-32]|uniref:SH3 domain-containing protein n=1 Tax=Fulvimarina uroteuthidis TaxID=3098149 RepID=A0ABU5I357_9HYPH|nr:SH3 domain-containing protein [Fulvimarina sp. 2208YS6-2-32]MDY8109572.1 SH3 domain-containing protein [Fulvimarina sp. 2208YS6-2-32]